MTYRESDVKASLELKDAIIAHQEARIKELEAQLEDAVRGLLEGHEYRRFHTDLEAINAAGKEGWELLSTYTNPNGTFHLMHRRCPRSA
jgi:vacuolar-type H+-ATPase subunit E/Vma4